MAPRRLVVQVTMHLITAVVTALLVFSLARRRDPDSSRSIGDLADVVNITITASQHSSGREAAVRTLNVFKADAAAAENRADADKISGVKTTDTIRSLADGNIGSVEDVIKSTAGSALGGDNR